MNKIIKNENEIKLIGNGSLAIIQQEENGNIGLLIKDNIEILKNLGTTIEYTGASLKDNKALLFIFLIKFVDADTIYEYALDLKKEQDRNMFNELIKFDTIDYILYSEEQAVASGQFKNVLKSKLQESLLSALKEADSLDYSDYDIEILRDTIKQTYSIDELWQMFTD